ncbi:S9 family peptidase [Microvirga sp. 17 mud 1-3]|uniref:S9 family peptidase n=1 Tax=Microvirga sp. 17 mud 1-3 TaxID=2082949 RepID=UPI000D6C0780|nr:S9 family peptidase [Microvirga sp. 17 mud 1-3]AWM86450.1 S9 family peptidase [Microvirga sp. 17 mud 1-3]
MQRERPSPLPLPPAPSVPTKEHSFTLYGTRIEDPYAWLKDENWKEVLKNPEALSPEIRTVLERENAYAAQVLRGTEAFQEKLVAEMRGRIKEDDSSVPAPDGPFSYFTRYREGGQHPLVCRMPRQGGAETIMLDGDREAEGHAFFDLGGADHSPDHRLMAWSADIKGSEYFTIRVRELESGRELDDAVPRTSGDAVWLGDSSGFYYVELDDNHRPVRVRRHILGRPAEEDAIVYEEKDPGFFVKVGLTQSGTFAVIEASDHETSEVWLLDRADPAARPRLVEPRTPQLQYDVEHRGDDLIILTNADGAEDFKIMTAPVATPQRQYWRDLVPYRPGTMILFVVALARHLVRLEREDAKPRIVVRDFATGREETIAFPEETYSLGVDPGYEFDTDTIRFRYSSLTTPGEVLDYDLRTGERTLRKRQEVPSGHNPDDYVTRRIFATAADGAQVPISLVHRREVVPDGTAPLLLYGYGSYGVSMSAAFRTNILSLVDRGFVYAIAHIRGGTEKGWHWYLDGKREKKTNTFTDFIAAGEALVAAGYTARGRIVAHGGSAGGMLMGAVANMAPDLFAGIVAEVPFVDVLNTMLDADLPLTPPEWPEWGNPGADEAAFRTILSYSPYDNVKAQAYPAILALAGLTDPRVTYWEPAKWAARLRATMTGGGPVVLKLNMEAGHGGAAGRFDRLEEVALAYTFALMCVEGFQG